MRLFSILITLLLSFVFAFTSFVGVLFFVVPKNPTVFQLSLFYVTLFLSLLCLFALLGLGLRRHYNKNQLVKRALAISLRQSFFFSSILVVFLFLKRHGGLNWWKMLVPVLFVSFLEYIFQNRE